MRDFFARCYVVSLARRQDRLTRFRGAFTAERWPFVTPEHYRAIDGKLCQRPDYWGGGGGAWGCFRSHFNIIEQCLMDRVPSVCILEDDATLCNDFIAKATAFLEAVPKDWQMLYLGGQHLFAGSHPPARINAHVFRPYNVNRTHAYALTLPGMEIVYKHLCSRDWQRNHHIDHHLGKLHMAKRIKVYCPKEWLIAQGAGQSNVNGRTFQERLWPAADSLTDRPFVAIVGLHSSGSSAVAAVCWNLGVHLGNKFGGYYAVDPVHRGFEAVGLAKICETAAPFPATTIKNRPRTYNQVSRWIQQRQGEARKQRKFAGGKYPLLCQLGEELQRACGDNLLVIHCDRPLAESVVSLQRRQQHQTRPRPCSSDAAAALQRWLNDGKQKLLLDIPPERQLSVNYDALLANPEREVRRIADFLAMSPTAEQLAKAVAVIRPEARHVKLEESHDPDLDVLGRPEVADGGTMPRDLGPPSPESVCGGQPEPAGDGGRRDSGCVCRTHCCAGQ